MPTVLQNNKDVRMSQMVNGGLTKDLRKYSFFVNFCILFTKYLIKIKGYQCHRRIVKGWVAVNYQKANPDGLLYIEYQRCSNLGFHLRYKTGNEFEKWRKMEMGFHLIKFHQHP